MWRKRINLGPKNPQLADWFSQQPYWVAFQKLSELKKNMGTTLYQEKSKIPHFISEISPFENGLFSDVVLKLSPITF